MPTDLYDIGRSTAVFLNRHFDGDTEEILQRTQKRERQRLIRHMVAGNCEPKDVRRLLTTLHNGWAEGMALPKTALSLERRTNRFLPVTPIPSGHSVFVSRFLAHRKSVIAQAEDVVKQGARASVFSFSLTPARHYVRYANGVWVQSGGQFGRTERVGSPVRWCNFAQRIQQEIHRIANVRGLDDNAGVKWWGGQAYASGTSKSEDAQ